MDIFNEINLNKQFNDGTMHNSISFECHPNTFKQLFDILEQLVTTMVQKKNATLNHSLTACIRLFKTHLQFLCTTKSKISKELLANIDDELMSTTQDSFNIDLTIFASDIELQKWFDLLLALACDDENKNSESITICSEASKALIYILTLKSTSIIEKLSFIHKYIINNKYHVLIEQLFIELNKTDTILNWIEILCHHKSEKREALTILYSFIDICFVEPVGSELFRPGTRPGSRLLDACENRTR
ncbi:unnamed protein product [Rotaria magnacalcarata]|uniref:Uncharacterized protein n=1 Tax=Rotaria magnacalcarata TaxID=392030 RepID=A0A816ATN8_9BILA|nr:unnamed protein product [Rotaria magnacalcarata]CAF4890058.1 unnamed protein product [Rotaria magnacalcarata]